MKVIKKTLNVVFILILAVAAAVFLLSVITARSNHGVPNYFGYQIMVVKTDSMAPTLPVGTGIVVKKEPIADLKPKSETASGDIISYYSPRYKAIVTHRLIGVSETDGQYTLQTIGENANSDQCGQTVCIYTPETVSGQNYMGKVVTVSDPLGGFFRFITHPLSMGFLIGIPAAYLVISLIYDIFNGKDDSKEEQAQ